MAGLFALTFALFLISWARSSPLTKRVEDVTISGPGVSNHGQSNFACFPTTATDVLLFFLTNYVAHAATVKIRPGASTKEKMFYILHSLFFPVEGVARAIEFMFEWSWTIDSKFPFLNMEANSLETAQRAGALAMVVRDWTWKPAPSDVEIRDLRQARLNEWGAEVDSKQEKADPPAEARNTTSQTSEPEGRGEKAAAPAAEPRPKAMPYMVRRLPNLPDTMTEDRLFGCPLIHGSYRLPAGYAWTTVPRSFKVRPYGEHLGDRTATGDQVPEVHLTSSFSILQPFIAILQTVSAGWTLYKARGDQIARYGFASFGLTVTPYLIMSIINFISQLATPQYGAMYVIHSEVLAEAAARMGNPKFVGIVGELAPDQTDLGGVKLFDARLEKTTSESETKYALVPAPAASGSSSSTSRQADRQGGSNSSTETPAAPAVDCAYVIEPDSQEPEDLLDSSTRIIIPAYPRFERREPQKYAVKGRIAEGEHRQFFAIVATPFLGLVSLAIIGGLSKFQPANSTTAQRGIIIAWMVCSISAFYLSAPIGLAIMVILVAFYAIFRPAVLKSVSRRKEFIEDTEPYYFIGWIVLAAVPIAMFVTVGQELVEYGNCQYIGS